jgi:PAS domain S-box-containing protein
MPATRSSFATYVVGVGVAGWMVACASLLLGPVSDADLTLVGLLWLAGVLANYAPLRFQRGGEAYGFDLQEAVFIAAILVLPGSMVPLLMASAALVGYGSSVKNAQKTLYNTGQVGLWSGAAALVVAVIGPAPAVLHPRTLAATVLAVIVLNAISLAANAELFRRMLDRPWRETFNEVWRLNIITAVGNTSFGLLLAIVASVEPLATILGSVLMVGMYLGYRGYVGVLEERERMRRLHAVTRSLVEATDAPDAMERFLDGIVLLLGGASAQLVLTDGTTSETVEVGRSGPEAGAREPALEEALRRGHPVHLDDGRIASLGAPLLHRGRTIGALAVTDRRGLEPWGDADLTLLATLADEAAVALRSVELYRTVEHERTRLAAETAKLHDVVNAASDGIVMLDVDGRIGMWNAAMAHITGVSEQEAMGQSWYTALRVRDEHDVDVLPGKPGDLGRFLDHGGRVESLDLQLLRRDGEWRWVVCSVAPVVRSDGQAAGVVVVARDITGEREVEALKADFVATVSHELRTPLTPLKGFLATMRNRGDMLRPDQVEAIHTSMATQVNRLESLIGDLLIVADIDRDTLRIAATELDLAVTARAAVDRETTPGNAERIAVVVDEIPTVLADEAATMRILQSLVSNALKHTTGNVVVRVHVDGDEACVSVEDEGGGIPEWEHDRVFERFHRLGDHLTRTQGPGLGLSIARTLADRQGGSIGLCSGVGRGSTFTLRLPLVWTVPGRRSPRALRVGVEAR